MNLQYGKESKQTNKQTNKTTLIIIKEIHNTASSYFLHKKGLFEENTSVVYKTLTKNIYYVDYN